MNESNTRCLKQFNKSKNKALHTKQIDKRLETASSGFKRFLPSITSSCFEIAPNGLERFQTIYNNVFINSSERLGAVQDYLYCPDSSGLFGTNWALGGINSSERLGAVSSYLKLVFINSSERFGAVWDYLYHTQTCTRYKRLETVPSGF